MKKRDLQLYDGVKKELLSEEGGSSRDDEKIAVSIPERIAISREKSQLLRKQIEALKRQLAGLSPVSIVSGVTPWPPHLVFFCKFALVAAFGATAISVLSLGSFLVKANIFADDLTARITGAMLILPAIYLKIRRENLTEANREKYTRYLWWFFIGAFASFLISVTVHSGLEKMFPRQFKLANPGESPGDDLQYLKIVLSSLIYLSLLLTDLTATSGVFIYIWEKLDFHSTQKSSVAKPNPGYAKVREEILKTYDLLENEEERQAHYKALASNAEQNLDPPDLGRIIK